MKNKYYYIIVICSFLITFFNVGYTTTSFGVYQPYITKLEFLTDSSASFAVGLRNLSSLISIFFVAIYYKKFNCRIAVSFATLFTAAGFFLYSVANNPIVFSLGSVCGGIGYSLGGATGMTLLVDNWFAKNRGRVLGLATMGSSFCGIVIPMLALNMINNYSISFSFGVQSLLAVGACLFFWFLIRNNPSDIGLSKFGLSLSQKKTNAEHTEDNKKSVSKLHYFCFIVGIFFAGASINTNTVYMSILFSSNGFDAVFCVGIVLTMNIMLAIGKFITGYIFDKLGTFRGTIIAFIILIIGMFLLIFASQLNEFMAYVSAGLFGLGTPVATVGLSKWSLDMSNQNTRERTIRDFQAAYLAGGFAFGILPGIIADSFGSYNYFFILSAVVSVLAAALIISLYPIKTRKSLR